LPFLAHPALAGNAPAPEVHLVIPAPTGDIAPTDLPSVSSWLEAQVELHRRGFSCGSIDGLYGSMTQAALQAFQRQAGIPESGQLDGATRDVLRLTAPALTGHVFTSEELASLGTVPATWLGKSEQAVLPYVTALEMAAERYRAAPSYLRRLNPQVDWDQLSPNTIIQVPAVERATITGTAERILIRLAAHELEVDDSDGRIMARFPVSIARRVEQRPVGELHVTVAIRDPNYTFDPEVFPESPEAAALGRKLTIPPGPNNPVGLAWIGLDRPGYGIHGTPDPEHIGRTESHGCFRLANWDAVTLVGLVRVGMTVIVEP
jgi:lipoprotein-anchoring transpeptidase ErfK/SrfK